MCGVVEGLHLKIVLRIGSWENIYEELRFYSVNNKVYIMFSLGNVRYLDKLATPGLGNFSC